MKKSFVLTMGVIFVLLFVFASGQSTPDVKRVKKENILPVNAVKPDLNFGKFPLYFISNKGQVDKQARFYAKASRYTLWLTKKGLVFDSTVRGKGSESLPLNRDVSRLLFMNADKDPEMVAVDEARLRVNYFIGNDRSGWHGDIPTSQAVLYKSLYRKIDLKVYGIEKQIEYDWIVKPGGNSSDIRFQYENVKGTRLDEEGNLLIETGFGELMHKRPDCYQQVGNERINIEAEFKRVGKNSYGFEVGDYDRRYELIIDPVVLAYSTYLGEKVLGNSGGIAVDSNGYIYVTGNTESPDFPVMNQYQTYQGDYDVFVTKIDPAQSPASQLIYSTYIGGSQYDEGYGIKVDDNNNAYVTGQTNSTDFPILNQYQTDQADVDAFVARLDTSQSGAASLVYCTYIGGEDRDMGYGIALDHSGIVHVTGETSSIDFPTLNQYQTPHTDGDVFISKIDTTQGGPSGLLYSTCLGGGGWDIGKGIAIDGNGNAYVTGITFSTDFPVLNQIQNANAYADVFVTKIDTNQSGAAALIYSTYLGGQYVDHGHDIAVDKGENVYVTGLTTSDDFPTRNAYKSNLGESYVDVFVTRLDTTQSGAASLIYSTFLGGEDWDQGNGIALDGSGNAYISGITDSADFPTKNQYQGDPGDSDSDVFVLKVDTNQTGDESLIYSTYLGGEGVDWARAIAVDGSGNAYITGYTSSLDFPTLNPYQAEIAYSSAFIAKLFYPILPTVKTTLPSSITTTSAESGGDVTYDGGASVTARGVCRSMSPNPTLQNNVTTDGTGTGTFTSSLTGLTPNTVYYVRAYATNEIGTAYGHEETFETKEPYIKVTSPNGLETWQADSSQTITWTSQYVEGNVKIDYSTDHGDSWTEIIASTTNDGSHPWTVPETSSTQCLVRVGEIDGSPRDISNGFFKIFLPTITVTTPDGGEAWEVNAQKTITWTTTGTVGNVKIEYSTDNGGQWTEIIASTDNDGSHPWTVPDTVSNLCLVRVGETGGTPSDQSNKVFSIVFTPSVTVLSPNGGETLYVGSVKTITWTSTGTVGNVKIEYSTDNGDQWTEIFASTGNDGSHPWTVPAAASDQCLVRVSETGEDPADSSDNVFSIQYTPTITVTSPNGGETPDVGSNHTVTWTSEGSVGNVRIEYSVNGGSTWGTIVRSTENDGSFNWTVPGKPSDNCLVRVSAGDTDGGVSDTSDEVFSIVPLSLGGIIVTAPNGGENWVVGSTHEITWTAEGIAQVPVVAVEYSINRGVTWMTVAAGVANDVTNALNWTIPNTPSDNCLVRVRGVDEDNAPSDTSDRLFKIPIPPSPSITVTTPNGGETWMMGDQRTITWETGGNVENVTIDYSVDSGDNWTLVVPSMGNNGSYEWYVPGTASDYCLVRVGDADSGGQRFDIGDAVFSIVSPPSITVTSPNGGEQWEAGSSQTITWTTTGIVGAVIIEYSVNGGENWTEIASPEPNDGSYNWTVPDPPSGDCLVRISGNDTDPNTELSDVGDAVFAITEAGTPALTVTSPNGGERLFAGAVHEIAWTSTGAVGNVDIDYSTDSGDNWTPVAQSTENDGSHEWTVPETASDYCLVRVGETDGSPLDIGDTVFSIVVPTEATLTVTAPNGGETWFVGSTQTITWTGTGTIDNVGIDYSRDNGVTWTAVTASTPNDGGFDWTVPDTPSDYCLVRITGKDGDWDDVPMDTGDDVFSIITSLPGAVRVVFPNGGESWEVGSVHEIAWNSTGNFGTVKIEYSPNGGGTWLTLLESTEDTGGYDWEIPDTPSDYCLVRIVGHVSESDEEVSDVSDGVFSIALPADPVITVETPNGGEFLYTGYPYNITWTSTGEEGEIEEVFIEYSSNGGDSWQTVTASVDNDGHFEWYVPDDPSDSCLVRISDTGGSVVDMSNAVFTIGSAPSGTVEVLAPNGGESLDGGSEYQIAWDSTGIETVGLEYSTNSGESWTFIAYAPAAGGVYTWTVPGVNSEYCLVRASGSDSDDNPSDESDGVFSIVQSVQAFVEVIAPNGGESLGVGGEYNITWESSGVVDVLIEYTYDNGESWETVEVVPAVGRRYTWSVPDTPSGTCRVRITGNDGGQNPTDAGDGVFSIIPNRP